MQPSKPKESENDDSEFKAQRQDAIAEATKAGTKKTFGGGSKMMVDTNVQKIIDKGFTEEQATTALKYSRNNVEKALSNLKRREENRQRANSNEYEPREYSKEKRIGKGSSAEPQAAKPSGAVSLFDFLENKFPAPDSAAKSSSYNEERFENNISSSFRKPDKDMSNNKSQHWSQHSSSGNEQKSSHNVRSSNNYNSRDYRDQPRDYRNNRDTRDSRDSRDTRDSRDYRDRDRDTKYQPSNSYAKSNSTASNQYQKPSSAINGGSFNATSSANRGKYQKPDYNNKSDYSKPGSEYKKDYNKDYSKDYGKDYSNNFAPSGGYNKSRPAAPSKYYNDQQQPNDYAKPRRNVVESMDKMSLKGNHQPYKAGDTKLNASNYPPLVPATEPPKAKTYTKPGYPIVGFQNKEANEHAKNVLKTKNIAGPQPQPQQQQQHQKLPTNWQQPHAMPVSQQTIKNQPPPPFPNVAQSGNAQMHSLPQPFVQHQTHSVLHAMPANPPAVFHQAINYPAPIIMQGVPPPPGMGPPPQQLKIGDLCLAKYWEDGQVSARH